MRLHHGKSLLPVSEVRSEINVTPLVDVCLVLLIIFMVVTPMLQKGVNVALPETNQPEKMPENQKQLSVSMKSDGSVYVDSKYVPEPGLPAAFKQVHDGNPDREIVVKGDYRLAYKDVRKLMKVINEAGFTRVGLVTEKKKKV
jgi:biopolymer transport protein ExbD